MSISKVSIRYYDTETKETVVMESGSTSNIAVDAHCEYDDVSVWQEPFPRRRLRSVTVNTTITNRGFNMTVYKKFGKDAKSEVREIAAKFIEDDIIWTWCGDGGKMPNLTERLEAAGFKEDSLLDEALEYAMSLVDNAKVNKISLAPLETKKEQAKREAKGRDNDDLEFGYAHYQDD